MVFDSYPFALPRNKKQFGETFITAPPAVCMYICRYAL